MEAMDLKNRRVLVLFDLAEPAPADHDYTDDLSARSADEWKSEADLASALRALDCSARYFGLYDNLNELVDTIKDYKPHVVFNLCEAFNADRGLEAEIAGLLQLLGVAYTGARPGALRLCKDKALSKKLVSFHGVRTPRFKVVRVGEAIPELVPAVASEVIIKPLSLESSTGISDHSLVSTQAEAKKRVKFIHDKLKADAIIEEFIVGRELYASVIAQHRAGRTKVELLPLRELFFAEEAPAAKRFLTYSAKWDDNYRKRWRIRSGAAKKLPLDVERKLLGTLTAICHALEITGYARIDLRLSEEGELVFLEANPNPSIAQTDDFARAAAASGINYKELIVKLMKAAEA